MDFDALQISVLASVLFAVGIGMILLATFRTPGDREPEAQTLLGSTLGVVLPQDVD